MWSEWTWWFRVALYFALPASFKRSRIGFNMFHRPLVQIERRGYISEEMLAINIVKSKLNQVDKGLPPACTCSWGWLKPGTGVIPLIVVQSEHSRGVPVRDACWSLMPLSSASALIPPISASSVDPDTIFANNEMSLRDTEIYGFDYDYTLAFYSRHLHTLIFNIARDLLISNHRVRPQHHSLASCRCLKLLFKYRKRSTLEILEIMMC